MRVHSLNCGTFCPLSRRLFNGTGSLFERGRLVCNCLLLETGDGLALVDTGFGLGDIDRPLSHIGPVWGAINRPRLTPRLTAHHQVEQLGYRPSDVRHIILTHLDFDHAGGLPDFPHARVHVHANEHDSVLYDWSVLKRRRYLPANWAHRPRWKLYHGDGDRWMGFEGVQAVEGLGMEVLLVPLFGHSDGHCGVAIRLRNVWLLHCGDAYFHHWEIASEGARTPLGLAAYENIYQENRSLRLRNLERLRDLVNERLDQVWIMNSHDPVYAERAESMLQVPVDEERRAVRM